MKHNNFRTLLQVSLLAFVVIGTIIAKLLDNVNDSLIKNLIFGITILLEILSMAYCIVGGIRQNLKTIDRYGSLNLFATVDRMSVRDAVIDSLQNDPSDHVIYVDCNGLDRTEVENIKQRLYEDFTHYHPKSRAKKHLFIKSVFVPSALEIEELNKAIFYNRSHTNLTKNIYIYDDQTANGFIIEQIAKRINGENAKLSRNICNTYIIYLTHFCRGNQKVIYAYTSARDIVNMLQEEYPSIIDLNGEAEIIKKNNYFGGIKDVLVFKSILQNSFYRIFIGQSVEYAYVIYNLKTGDYKKGIEILAKCSYVKDMQGKSQVVTSLQDFCYKYLLADSLHLLNCYEAAYSVSTTIPEINSSDIDNENVIIDCYNKKLELQAHIAKHVGLFTTVTNPSRDEFDCDSNTLLNKIKQSEDKSIYKLKKILNLYLENQMRQIEGQDTIRAFRVEYEIIDNLETCGEIDQQLYYPVFIARTNPNRALSCIDDILEYYLTTEHRRRYNAFYIKAEILRIMNKYEEAYDYYLKASGMFDGHHDINLLDQTYFSLKALELLGVVNGFASYQVKQYRNEFYTANGFRNDYEGIVQIIRKCGLPHVASIADDTQPRLQFNEALLHYIDSKSLRIEELKQLLAAHIFIIL